MESAPILGMPGILSDRQIKEEANRHGMIQPFSSVSVNKDADGKKICSYGLSSYGYDVRLSGDFKVARDTRPLASNPGHLDIHDAWSLEDAFVTKKVANGGFLEIPPHGFVLACTEETIRMPKDCLAICMGKSTYARVGLVVNVTPLEPGWEGQVTMELSNTTHLPVRVYVGEGIMQILFFRGAVQCEHSYTSRSSKYMNQRGPTLPRM